MLLTWHWIMFCALFQCRILKNVHFEGIYLFPLHQHTETINSTIRKHSCYITSSQKTLKDGAISLVVSVCWCKVNRYMPSKCTFFRILHWNRAQNIIQCYDINIWKQMCIKKLSYSTYTYIRYNVQRGKKGQKIHVSSTLRIGPIPKK